MSVLIVATFFKWFVQKNVKTINTQNINIKFKVHHSLLFTGVNTFNKRLGFQVLSYVHFGCDSSAIL